MLTLWLVFRLIEDPPYLSRLKAAGVKLDYIGIAFLALGVGALQVMLDRGQEDDWFGSHFILTLAIVSGVCLVSLVIWEWFSKNPIIEVRLFKNFNYLSSNLMMFTFGILLFSSLVMMPLFLQTLLGYTAELAGLVLSGGGLVLLFAMPIVGQLTTKFQVRYIIAFGWLCLAIAMYYSTQRIDLLISFSFRFVVARRSGCRSRLPFRADHAGGLHRHAGGKEQCRCRHGQFHAQHREQRGDFHGHNADRPSLRNTIRRFWSATQPPGSQSFQNLINGLAKRSTSLGNESA